MKNIYLTSLTLISAIVAPLHCMDADRVPPASYLAAVTDAPTEPSYLNCEFILQMQADDPDLKKVVENIKRSTKGTQKGALGLTQAYRRSFSILKNPHLQEEKGLLKRIETLQGKIREKLGAKLNDVERVDQYLAGLRQPMTFDLGASLILADQFALAAATQQQLEDEVTQLSEELRKKIDEEAAYAKERKELAERLVKLHEQKPESPDELKKRLEDLEKARKTLAMAAGNKLAAEKALELRKKYKDEEATKLSLQQREQQEQLALLSALVAAAPAQEDQLPSHAALVTSEPLQPDTANIQQEEPIKVPKSDFILRLMSLPIDSPEVLTAISFLEENKTSDNPADHKHGLMYATALTMNPNVKQDGFLLAKIAGFNNGYKSVLTPQESLPAKPAPSAFWSIITLGGWLSRK